MKKLFFILLFPLILFSCQQTELQFSCDPAIDAYVAGNLKSLSLLTFSELADYELPLQRAIFNSWDAEKKRNAWIDKLYFVLENESFAEDEVIRICGKIPAASWCRTQPATPAPWQGSMKKQ